MVRRNIVLALSLAALTATACGATAKGLDRKVERGDVSADRVGEHGKLVADAKAAWDKRAERTQLELAISKWQAAVLIKDSDWESYSMLARATYLLADGYLFFEQNNAAGKAAYLAAHERGYAFAERGLAAVSTDFEKRRLAGTKIEDAIKVIGRNGVPMVYWYASNLGKWATAKGFTTVLENKDKIFKLVSRVYEIGPDYFYGASDRYFGAFYSIAPKFAGGDVMKSFEHFQASLKAAPNYLGTYVLIAEYYTPLEDTAAGKGADAAAFEANLSTVINAQPCPPGGAPSGAPCILPELAAEAAIEKRKALELLKRKDDLF